MNWVVFVEAIRKGNKAPIPYEQLMDVTKASFAWLIPSDRRENYLIIKSIDGLSRFLIFRECRIVYMVLGKVLSCCEKTKKLNV